MSKKPIVPFPALPEHLKEILAKPEPKAQDQLQQIDIPGECRIHGKVGFARFILHDNGEILSEYCSKCLSRIMSALIGELQYPDEKD